jgi:penicillin-insensitive murein DD-endopeptidase
MPRLLFLIAAVAWSAAGRADPANDPVTWSHFRTPTTGAAEAIGAYSSGCVLGAVALPVAGPGFKVVWPDRSRFYGHPLLVALIRDLGGRVEKLHLPKLSVGDLGQPRGGPAPTGHASHQTGLDVDLYFVTPKGHETTSLVDDARRRPSPRFTAAMARVIELAADDARVDRLFIHPVLKRAMCERSTGDRAWLRKLTPWWGHDDHVHVRLACPADSASCVPQKALPDGNGCDELAWWFDTKDEADRTRAHKRYSARVGAAPDLPAACRALVGERGSL